MNHRENPSFQEAEADESLLTVIEAVVVDRDRLSLKKGLDSNEVNAMLSKIRLPLRLVPLESHSESVAP